MTTVPHFSHGGDSREQLIVVRTLVPTIRSAGIVVETRVTESPFPLTKLKAMHHSLTYCNDPCQLAQFIPDASIA